MRSPLLPNWRRKWKNVCLSILFITCILGIVYATINGFLDQTTGFSFLSVYDQYLAGYSVSYILTGIYRKASYFAAFGFLFPLLRGRKCWNETCLSAEILGTIIELFQLISGRGMVCGDDILICLVASFGGHILFVFLCRFLETGRIYLWDYPTKHGLSWLIYLFVILSIIGAENSYGFLHYSTEPISTNTTLAWGTSTYGVISSTGEKREREICDYLSEKLAEGYTTITLSLMGPIDRGAYSSIFSQIHSEHPELFWLNGGGYISTSTSFGVFSSCTFTFSTLDGVDNIDAMRSVFDQTVEAMVNEASRFESDYEKALYVHDTIVQLCEYDYDTYYSNFDEPTISGTAYGCLVNHTAVCAGYARAYQLIMTRLGIECLYITGTAGNSMAIGPHAWNCINLDGDYYLVDVTWDDPTMVETYYSAISHRYFCVTTDYLSQDHTPDKDQYVPLCTSKKYKSLD